MSKSDNYNLIFAFIEDYGVGETIQYNTPGIICRLHTGNWHARQATGAETIDRFVDEIEERNA